MLGSLSPVGETSRGQRWWLTATAYAAASTMAGAAIGWVLGAAGQAVSVVAGVPPAGRLLVLCGAVLAGAMIDAGVLGRRLPTWHRQVDERWLTRYRGWVYGAGFGAQLGLGVVTIVTSAVTYTTLAAAFLSATSVGGAAIGLVFGAARAMPLLFMGGVDTPERLYTITRTVTSAEPRLHRMTIAGQAALAAALLSAAVIA